VTITPKTAFAASKAVELTINGTTATGLEDSLGVGVHGPFLPLIAELLTRAS
jgi:hypothetical protein